MDKTELDRLHFVGGEMQALMSFAFAVIESHPAPEILRKAFDLHIEPAIAQATPSPETTDKYLEGMQDTAERLRKCIAISAELRSAGVEPSDIG